MERIITKQEVLKLTPKEWFDMMNSKISKKEYINKHYYKNKGYTLLTIEEYGFEDSYNYYYLTTFSIVDLIEYERLENEKWDKEFQEKKDKTSHSINYELKKGDIINIKEGHKISTNIVECMLYNNPQHGTLYVTTPTSTRVIEAMINPTGIFSYLQGDYKITTISKIQERYDEYMGYIPSETIVEAVKIDNSEILVFFSVNSSFRRDNNDIGTVIK